MLVTGVATGTRLAMDVWLGPQLPFVTYLPAVAVAVWLAGFGPACATAVLGALLANYLFIAPPLSVELTATGPAASLASYLIGSALIILIGHIAHERKEHLARRSKALEESEARLRHIADSSPVLIWMSDAEKRGIYFNRAWVAYTGRSVEQELGDGWLDAVHPDDLAALDACAPAVEQHRPFTTQIRLRSAAGEYRRMVCSAFPRSTADDGFLGFTGSCTDIHDSKLADESRAMLASIVSTASCAIISKSLDGRILSWNAGAERILGYTAEEAIGQTIDLIVPPELRREERDILRRLNLGQRVDELETTRVTKDGRRIQRMVTISPVRDDSGRLVGASKVGLEVTWRKRAEEALRVSEEGYRAVVETQTELLCRFHTDGTILFVNGAYIRARNSSRESLIGRNFWQFIPEGERAEVRLMIDRLTPDAPEIRIENRFETADGLRWILWTNRALRFDANGHWLEAQSTGIDITDRKAMEVALRDSEQRFAQFMRHLPGLAWIKDANGRYVFANEAAQEVFGKQPKDLFGRTDLEIFPPEIAESFRQNDTLALDDETGMQTVETLAHPDGEVHHSPVSKFPIPTPDGSGLVGGVAIDITERLRAEDALRESSRHKDAFLATLGHELRNPLAPLRTGLDIVARSTTDARLGQVVSMMERQLAHLLRLVDDLLDVSRIESGKLRVSRQRMDLGAAVSAAVEQAQPLISERSHELIIDGDGEGLIVSGDPERLTQVVANLLTNAAKFTRDGGVVRLTTVRNDDRAEIHVEDTGFGISAARQATLFETFRQTPEHTAQLRGGLGVGLALAKHIVDLHDGTIALTSGRSNSGSEFVITLPLSSAPLQSPSAQLPTVREHPAGGARPPADQAPDAVRVRVVDDNTEAADTLAILLESKGHVVRTVYDGKSGLHAISEFEPSLVLLDIGMPGMDGYEVARRVRALPDGAQIALCAITGWGQSQDKQRALDAGFDMHFTKPVDPARLDALIGMAVEAHTAKLDRPEP
jgi:PAS domain S-box-containing protein